VLNVGLTGNVAAGKSSVALLFRDWGATIIDADAIVRRLQRPGTAIFQAIADRFGPGALRPDGSLDRPALRARILADPAEKLALEAIVHPAVEAERQRLLRRAAAGIHGIVVNDIPLLFETMEPSRFDAIVLVDAPEPVRMQRLIQQRGLPAGDAARVIAAQLPAEAKRARAHFVIENDGSREMLRDRAWRVWRKLVSQARALA
jgi:dephospho-CoA kinase